MKKHHNGLPRDLILAMRQPYLDLLLNGTKTVELRTTHPKLLCEVGGRRIWGTMYGKRLYLARRGFIHGEVLIDAIDFNTTMPAHFAVTYAERACLDISTAVAMLKGRRTAAAYHVSHPIRYAAPVCIMRTPQSWQYAAPDIVDMCAAAREATLQRKEAEPCAR